MPAVKERFIMKVPWLLAMLSLAFVISARAEKRDVSVNTADGFALKGTLYAAANPGPGLLLLHPCGAKRQIYDRDRKSVV